MVQHNCPGLFLQRIVCGTRQRTRCPSSSASLISAPALMFWSKNFPFVLKPNYIIFSSQEGGQISGRSHCPWVLQCPQKVFQRHRPSQGLFFLNKLNTSNIPPQACWRCWPHRLHPCLPSSTWRGLHRPDRKRLWWVWKAGVETNTTFWPRENLFQELSQVTRYETYDFERICAKFSRYFQQWRVHFQVGVRLETLVIQIYRWFCRRSRCP